MTGPMNLISAPARELEPASRRAGAETGRSSAEAAPQHAFEQALDMAREHSQPPKHQSGSAASTGSTGSASSAGGASAEASAPSEPTTSRRTGLPAFFAAAWGPAAEISSSTAQRGNTVAAVIDLDFVRGTATGPESAVTATADDEALAAAVEVAESARAGTTDAGTPAVESELVDSARTEAGATEPAAGAEELGTDVEQATQTRHPFMPGGEEPAAQSERGGEVIVSDETVLSEKTDTPNQPDDSGKPVSEEPVPGPGQSLGSDGQAAPNDQAVPGQMPAASPAARPSEGGISAEQLADQELPPASSTPPAATAEVMQSAEGSPNVANTRLHEGAVASAPALQVPRQQVQEGAEVSTPVPTGNVEGDAAGSAPVPTLDPSSVTTSMGESAGTVSTVGAAAETPLAPTTSSTTSATAASAAVLTAQAAGVQPTAAPTPAAAAQPAAPAAPPLQAQLAGPIAQLATGPTGEKVLTVNVAPENLGPVTVRANISGDAMRIELFAPQDAGREALRGMLTELRRDLAGLGLGSSQVSLGEGDAPSSSSGQPRGDAQPGERSRDPAAGQQPAEDSGPRDQQRGPNAEQVLDQLSGAPAVSRLVGSALLPEAPHPVGLDLLA